MSEAIVRKKKQGLCIHSGSFPRGIPIAPRIRNIRLRSVTYHILSDSFVQTF